MRIIRFMQDQWFLITLVILVVISSQHQVPVEHQKTKSTLVSYICVSVIFFLTGCTLKTQILIENYSRWKIHLFVQLQSFFMTSLVMFAIVSMAASNKDFMDPGLLVGMILTGCVATTISSNVVMTGDAHGNQALTVVQSTIGNVLGPFITPLLFKGYTSSGAWYNSVLPAEPGGYGELYKRVFKQLGLSVFIPLLVGQAMHNFFPGPVKLLCTTYKLSKLGSMALLIIIWQTYDSAFSSGAIRQVPGSNIAFVVFMSMAMFGLFLLISLYTAKMWLSRADTVACCYCVPAKTPAMGVPISTVLFVGLTPMLEAKLQLPLVLYQGLQIMAGTILTGPFRRWVDSERQEAEPGA
ncbi:sodium bile acid symporter family protein [Microthyrium microscopicum]|uniref:Sodium bile acid symporter family protein n=1 Tax=Microthyrium microscopicum TaxID=703497 RepID=A0A6A6TUT8_9PEZI|nr:sodium bile acid symporter family protein [Microthyrium microscopicum]